MTEQEKQARIQELRVQIQRRFFDPACREAGDPVLTQLLDRLEELEPSPKFDVQKGLEEFWATFEQRRARIEGEGEGNPLADNEKPC